MSRLRSVLPRGLVVSCQALADEPLHSAFIMSRLALSAREGGAIGIRANSKQDIVAIKQIVSLPVIGIVKKEYAPSEVYITPTLREVQEVHEAGAEIVAFDATARTRPDNRTVAEYIHGIKATYPDLLLMADIATYEEARFAADNGVDAVSTTLCGYTRDTACEALPAFTLLQKLASTLSIPVIAV